MRQLLAIALVLVVPLVAPAQTVTLPKEVKVAVGRLATVPVVSDGKDTKWFLSDPDVDVFREYDPNPANIRLRLIAYKEGTVRLTALTCKGDVLSEPATCVIVVGEPAPPPLPPPTDPFVQALQAAYAAEADPQKATQRANLAALYRQSGAAVDQSATWGALFDVLSAAAQSLGVSGKLPGVQKEIAAYFKTVLPTARDAVLDATGKATAKAAFLKVATALEAVR